MDPVFAKQLPEKADRFLDSSVAAAASSLRTTLCGVVAIKSQWTARDRELKIFSGWPGFFSAQVSVQTTAANLERQAWKLRCQPETFHS